ncbi:MAG: dicarboxylate/amino acid:cation symporter [Halieaceae bacterium]|jgi:Na+/H+-dicarboxylate symporter|nr:dicarboxylate/amino acid:cation symporter [Halieaceae bacterium]
MTLTTRILIAMVIGIGLGSLLNVLAGVISPGIQALLDTWVIDGVLDVVGRMFVASLKMLVVPLVFVSLVCGASSLGNNARMGRIALRTVLLYLFTTGIAVTLALVVALAVDPGKGVDLPGEAAFEAAPAPSIADVIVGIVPSNPVQAMAEGNMLQVIVFALLIGFAITRSGEAGKRICGFFTDLEVIIMKIVGMLMLLAPYGVGALLTKLFAHLGFSAIVDLGKYFLTVLFVLLFHGFVVYSGLLKALVGLPPSVLLYKMRSVWAFAFSTSSSAATIPITLRTVERKLGVKPSVAGFTIPLGATVNMDGTAIMQGVATVFIAQVYGVDLSLGDLAAVVLTATLASVGAAGVPGVGLITLALVLEQVGLPVEGIAMIIGVDRLLDMVRTSVNVTGDAMVSLVVAELEGQVDKTIFGDWDADSMTARNYQTDGDPSRPGFFEQVALSDADTEANRPPHSPAPVNREPRG